MKTLRAIVFFVPKLLWLFTVGGLVGSFVFCLAFWFGVIAPGRRHVAGLVNFGIRFAWPRAGRDLVARHESWALAA